MIYADTDGLLDRCHCGAVSGFEDWESRNRVRVRCTECCEQTGFHCMAFEAAHTWNKARRAEKERNGLIK